MAMANEMLAQKFELPDLNAYTKKSIDTLKSINTQAAAAEKEIKTRLRFSSMIKFSNVIAVLLMFISTGFFLYNIKENIKYHRYIYNAIYNEKGFSVFNGAIYSKEIMPKTDPEYYKELTTP